MSAEPSIDSLIAQYRNTIAQNQAVIDRLNEREYFMVAIENIEPAIINDLLYVIISRLKLAEQSNIFSLSAIIDALYRLHEMLVIEAHNQEGI